MIVANCECLIRDDYCRANSLWLERCNDYNDCIVKKMIKAIKAGRDALAEVEIVEAENV